ncbi:MAG TPA: energy-coupling factor transporter ATPase [bacterium]|nr:energy-coupling factor transporter ATPase [bacterium]
MSIEVKNLSFDYEGISVLRDVNFQIDRGEFIGIAGPNGSGKSTLARCLNGIFSPVKGEVVVDGISVKDTSKQWIVRQTVGLVFQNPDNQLVASIVEEDVAFGPENLGIPPAIIRERVQYALERVGLINERKRPVSSLSGGQKQRVAIAGILAMRPEYIVLDEPTSMLDPVGRKEVLSTVLQLKEEGVGIVYITHHLEELVYADKIILLYKGEVFKDGSAREILTDEETLTRIGLDIPEIPALSLRLKGLGIDFNETPLTIEEMVNVLFN